LAQKLHVDASFVTVSATGSRSSTCEKVVQSMFSHHIEQHSRAHAGGRSIVQIRLIVSATGSRSSTREKRQSR